MSVDGLSLFPKQKMVVPQKKTHDLYRGYLKYLSKIVLLKIYFYSERKQSKAKLFSSQ